MRKKIFAALAAAVLALCLPAGIVSAATDSAYKEIRVTSISAPVFTDGTNVTFKISFSGAVSDTALEHFNASDSFLTSALPEVYSKEFLAQLDDAGVRRSVKSNIILDDKSIQEYMDADGDISDVAVMFHLRGTEAEFTVKGSYDNDGSPTVGAITDINREFVFEFREGLLFPTDSRVSQTQKFVFNPDTKAWRQISSGGEVVEASAEIEYISYNGIEITSGATIWLNETKIVSKDLFFVELKDSGATWTINKTTLSPGINRMTVTVTASDGVTTDNFTFIMETATDALKDTEFESGDGNGEGTAPVGCGTTAGGGGGFGITLAAVGAALAAVLLLVRKETAR